MSRASFPSAQRQKLVIFIVGPTGVGKSDTGVELALKIDGEIISADSMQIYRGMDIGTAKPSRRLLRKVPHHLIDIVWPNKVFSVFQFYRKAVKAIREIHKRGRIPVVVGGTGFYVRALVDGLSSGVKANFAFRKKMEKIAHEKGPEYLHQELQKKDLSRAQKINPCDLKRIIRALEIIHFSGQAPSESKKNCKPLSELGFKVFIFGLNRNREFLYSAINNRVESMFRRGLVKEARKVLKNGVSRTSMHAVGYKEIWRAIEKGDSPNLAMDEIKKNTRNYAKRQITWFKRERGIVWIDFNEPPSPKKCALNVIQFIRNGPKNYDSLLMPFDGTALINR